MMIGKIVKKCFDKFGAIDINGTNAKWGSDYERLTASPTYQGQLETICM